MNSRKIPINKIKGSLLYFEDIRYSPEKINELAKSIQELGLLNPVVVYQDKDGKYVVVDGYRRFLAYKKLAKKDKAYREVPVVVIDKPTDLAPLINEVAEKWTPYTLAMIVKHLSEKGHSIVSIARAMGKTKGYISMLLRVVNNAPPEVLEQLKEGKLTIRQAYNMIKRKRKKKTEPSEPKEEEWEPTGTWIDDYIKNVNHLEEAKMKGANVCFLCHKTFPEKQVKLVAVCLDDLSAITSIYNYMKHNNITMREVAKHWYMFKQWLREQKKPLKTLKGEPEGGAVE